MAKIPIQLFEVAIVFSSDRSSNNGLHNCASEIAFIKVNFYTDIFHLQVTSLQDMIGLSVVNADEVSH